MAIHSFDPEIAAKVGVNAAVLYQNLVFWTQKNFINKKHLHDGLVWTYNSIEAWEKLFPYLTGNQIRTALKKLVDAGLVKEGNYNATAYDRTKWYGLSVEIHFEKNRNGNGQKGQPIPDSKPDIKPDIYIARARRLPQNWVPGDLSEQFIKDYGVTQQVVDTELDKFKNYWLSKPSKNTSLDWNRQWRTWLMNAHSYKSNSRGPSKGRGQADMEWIANYVNGGSE